MATGGEALKISQYSQTRLTQYVKNIISYQRLSTNIRDQLLQKDREYQREVDRTYAQAQAAAHNRVGDTSKIQNVTMPVIMPQVEATHAYLVETFLSGYPVFPVVSGPEYSEVAKQLDAIMSESATRFQYVRHLGMAIRDGLKYNMMAVEVEWKNLKVYTVGNDAIKDVVFGVPVEEEFSGNIIKRLDPYNTIIDQRVHISEVHEKADFAGYVELMTYIQLKNLFLELDSTLTMNATEAFASPCVASSLASAGDVTQPYYVPQVNPNALRAPTDLGMNWFAWAGVDENTKNTARGDLYQVVTMYLRIIPREFGINTGKAQAMNGVPQIIKVIVVNGEVPIYVERKSNAHNYLPIVCGQPIEDGLNYQTKSFADNASPYQYIATALYNSAMQSQRRKVYDRIYYDPSRINKSDMDRVDPVARIAVKTSAYGRALSDAVYAAPYRDEGVSTILAMARDVSEMADTSTGQNKVQRGQFQKGNKTLREFESVMDKSDARNWTMAVLLEAGWFQPIKHIMKLNILQFQPPKVLFNQQTQEAVKITPSQLRSVAWQFKIADGVMPVSKLLNPELMTPFLQYMGQAAQLGQPMPYDIPSMIVYNMKLAGATWVDAFKFTKEQQRENELRKAKLEQLSNKPAPPEEGASPPIQ